MLRKLTAITPRVSVLSDITLLPQDSSRCLGSRSATRHACIGPQNPGIAAMDGAWKRATEATGTRYVDMVPWFCQDDVCPIVVGSTIVYRDSNHVTETYAETLKPVLAQQLDLAGP